MMAGPFCRKKLFASRDGVIGSISASLGSTPTVPPPAIQIDPYDTEGSQTVLTAPFSQRFPHESMMSLSR